MCCLSVCLSDETTSSYPGKFLPIIWNLNSKIKLCREKYSSNNYLFMYVVYQSQGINGHSGLITLHLRSVFHEMQLIPISEVICALVYRSENRDLFVFLTSELK